MRPDCGAHAVVSIFEDDESDLLNYDTSFKQAAQDAIYAPDAYRSSDHDPVISGFGLLNFTSGRPASRGKALAGS